MHVILGANGVIGEGVARHVRMHYSEDVVLVGRNPEAVHAGDVLRQGDVLVAEDAHRVIEDAEIVYLTAGLPYKSSVWLRDWPIMLTNVVEACAKRECKLVYFDNTYAYAQEESIQVESSPLTAQGKKGVAKRRAAEIIWDAIEQGDIKGMICRAPEFYGPGKTKSITNSMIFERLQNNRRPKVMLDDKTLRTLIFTPDASAAMSVLANTDDAYGQVWHLPCCDQRLTYQGWLEEVSRQLKRPIDYDVLSSFQLKMLALFISNVRETKELFARYRSDNLFESSKFKERFPDFPITSYRDGIAAVLRDMKLI